MNMPNSAVPHVNPKIESLFQSLARRYEERWTRACIFPEEATIREALRLAAARPDENRGVSETMEASYGEADIQRLERHAKAFSFANYSTVFSNLLSDDEDHAPVA